MGTSIALGALLADTYRVVRLVGVGGMGEVYEATHDRLAGRYAIKVLLAEVSDRAGMFQRFRREAEVTSGLRHPNIVQVVDFNVTPDGHPYLVMEYLDGVELAGEIARVGAMPVARALDIVGQIASALTAAHSHKIVHRDLKPQNLFLVRLPGEEREVVKVVDFGISKVREATTKLTQEAAVIGTPQYMAPEQAQGKLSQIDERTDEFALGAIAYELLTGCPAFRGDAVSAILYQVVHEAPEPIRSLSPKVGPAVESVVLKAMAKARENRYPTVLAFHRALAEAAASDHNIRTALLSEPAAESQGEAVERTGTVERTPTTLGSAVAELAGRAGERAGFRRGWIFAGILVAAGALALSSIWWARRHDPANGRAAAARSPVAAKVSVVEVENAPPGLTASVDGVMKPLPIELPFGAEAHVLSFQAPGFETTELRVDGMREHRSIVLAMKPSAGVVAEKPSAGKPAEPAATDEEGKARAQREPPSPGEPADETRRRAAADPSRNRAKAKATQLTKSAAAPSPEVSPRKGEGKGLRDGSRGTKISESFE